MSRNIFTLLATHVYGTNGCRCFGFTHFFTFCPMPLTQISLPDAQKIALYAQLLLPDANEPPLQASNPLTAVVQTLEHLGYVQIDTLSVVARAHHHVLWTRLGNAYSETVLHELQATHKLIFEYWSHAASYLPMSHYRFTLPTKEHYAGGKSHWFEQDIRMKQYVLERIAAEGALQTKDFEKEPDKVGQSWYAWSAAKRALEQLFMEGRLMVSRRKGFNKVYDLCERVLPNWVNTMPPTDEEYSEFLVKTALRAHGIITLPDVCYLRPRLKNIVQQAINRLQNNGFILPVKVGNANQTAYTLPHMPDKALITPATRHHPLVHLLSPFDNVVIQRKRLQQLFGFDYQIECYMPQNKRKYGYFSLPVLWNNQFIGRIDPKTDRKSGIFYIKNRFVEPNAPPMHKWQPALEQKLQAFAQFNGCNRVVYL